MQFRKDINGLRALAVTLVMLFHFNAAWLPGGFSGVDMFLVISGFLITNILIKNKDSIVNFYIKRIKRILPNTYVIIFTTLVFGYFFSLPSVYRTDSLSSFFSLFYLANIRFAFLDDYFNQTYISPVLHLWSLSLEEQFYILFPFLLLLVKDKKARIAAVAILILVSIYFIFSLDMQFAYFLLQSRMFGLLLGGMVALLSFKLKKIPFLSFFIVLVLGCILFFDIPKEYVIIIATLLSVVIISTKDSLVHNILGSRLLNKIGELSFSMYLWHWPIIAFSVTLDLFYENSLLYLAVYFSLTLFLSIITKKYVEDKFRYYKGSKVKVFTFYLVIPMFILGVTSFYIFKHDGLPERFNLEAELTRTMSVPIFDKIRTYEKYGPALIVDVENEKGNILLIGDSHSGHFVDLFKRLSELNVINYDVYWAQAGTEFYNNERLKQDILDYGGAAVVLATRVDHKTDEHVHQQVDFISEIKHKNLYVIGQVPKLDDEFFKDENIVQKYIKNKLPTFIANIDDNYRNRNYIFSDKFNVLDFSDLLLVEGKGRVIADGKLLYIDSDHINSFASKWLADECLKVEKCKSDIEHLLK